MWTTVFSLFVLIVGISSDTTLHTNDSSLASTSHPSHIYSSPQPLSNSNTTTIRVNETMYHHEHEYEYDVCVICRMKNVHMIIPQWIEYHLLAGIDHFFFMDDCSNDYDTETTTGSSNTTAKKALTPYWMEIYAKYNPDIVSLYQAPNDSQHNCSEHVPNEFHLLSLLYKDSRSKCKWMLQLDPDEYILPSVDTGYCIRHGTMVHLGEGAGHRKLREKGVGKLKQHEGIGGMVNEKEDNVIDLERDRTPYNSLSANHTTNTTFTKLPDCMSLLKYHLSRHTNIPLFRFILTIMSNEGLLTRPPGLIIDNYVHGNYFTHNQLIKTIAQTKYFHDWQWPNYPDGLDIELCNHDKCLAHLQSTGVATHWKNPRFQPHEIAEFPIYVDGKIIKCGYPAHFPFYIRHYQALSWDDHQELRVKRHRSASNTVNGWAGGDEHAWKTWKSYHFNHTCPVGGEMYRKVMSEEVMKAIHHRLRQWINQAHPHLSVSYATMEALVTKNVEQWRIGKQLIDIPL